MTLIENGLIPIRYHDINNMLEATTPEMVEFMSYNDLNLNPEQYLILFFTCEFIVHAPELFENDHLLDFVANDDTYRKKSLGYLRRVVDVTKIG